MSKRKPYSAFTLIELLIVVAILGILAAISGTHYIHALARADAALCQQNLRTLHTALQAYRADFNHFPPADGTAGMAATPNQTAFGCGPAANGYWSGISYLVVQNGYCSENTLYCPALKRAHKHSIDPYPTCGGTAIAGESVPAWRFLRYAYNRAALDAGGAAGGERDIDSVVDQDAWLARCLHLSIGEFDPERKIAFPFRLEEDELQPGKYWYGEFELTVQGTIRPRKMELR